MSQLAFTLRTKKFGNFTYAQWLVIIFLFLGIMYGLSAYLSSLNQPAPTIYEGDASGVFHGRRYGFYISGTTSEEQAQNCYANSYLYFWGNLTMADGTRQDVSLEGREIRGLICIQTVNSYIWSSTDQSPRTPITFHFKGTISTVPMLDWSPLVPWFGWGATILIVFYLIRRKLKPPDFDALAAEEVFSSYVEAKGYRPIAPVEIEQQEAVGGKQFTVAQMIEGQNAPRTLILEIDNHKRILRKRFDEHGDIYRADMSKEARMLEKEMRKAGAKYTEADVYEQADKMLREHMAGEQRKKPRTPEERAAETRRLSYQTLDDVTQVFPKYDKNGKIIEE